MEKTSEKGQQKKIKITINSSGMYQILWLAINIIGQNNDKTIEAKDLKQYCEINQVSISQNLNRLVKAGILERIDDHKGHGRIIKYQLKESTRITSFIIQSLYGGNK